MSERILFVDDEVEILESMKRQLRKRYDVVTAESGREALEILKKEGPFSVVVSDMRMPVMNGIELLERIKDMYPDTVRMMLTGNADQNTAIEAVNKGQIFRFLNKPCPTATLITSLALAQRQYRLVTAEKELLDETLKGSVKVLSELLSFTSPMAFSSGLRIRSLVMAIARALGVDTLWQLEVAALVSQIGCVTLPAEILDKLNDGIELDEEERQMYSDHPAAGARLLEKIPRMAGVTAIIRNQLLDFCEYESDDMDNDEINLCAQIIRVVLDYDMLRYRGEGHGEAVRRLKNHEDAYNPAIVDLLGTVERDEVTARIVSLKIAELAVGMVAEENITAKNETLLVPRGQEITWPVLQGLKNFSKKVGVNEPVRVAVKPL